MNHVALDKNPLVAMVMGSKTDAHPMLSCKELLAALEIPYQARVISAHRAPDELRTYVVQAVEDGVEVFIAGAGAAAALPGAVAAHTSMPVIGIPLNTTSLLGLDALLAIVQMPAGIPVATMAIGEAGAKNAALYAARILANKHENIRTRLGQYLKHMHATAKENVSVDPFAGM